MDNVIFYAFKGAGVLNGDTAMKAQQACRFDATTVAGTASLKAGSEGFRLMVFAGKMTKETIVWHGPFVCQSKQKVCCCLAQPGAALCSLLR